MSSAFHRRSFYFYALLERLFQRLRIRGRSAGGIPASAFTIVARIRLAPIPVPAIAEIITLAMHSLKTPTVRLRQTGLPHSIHRCGCNSCGYALMCGASPSQLCSEVWLGRSSRLEFVWALRLHQPTPPRQIHAGKTGPIKIRNENCECDRRSIKSSAAERPHI